MNKLTNLHLNEIIDKKLENKELTLLKNDFFQKRKMYKKSKEETELSSIFPIKIIDE